MLSINEGPNSLNQQICWNSRTTGAPMDWRSVDVSAGFIQSDVEQSDLHLVDMHTIRESYGFSSMIHEVISTEAELEAMIYSDPESYSDSDSYSDTDSDTESMTDSDTDNGYAFVQDCKSAVGLDLTEGVFLDSESTVHAFCNRDLVNNIFHVDKSMNLVSNGNR